MSNPCYEDITQMNTDDAYSTVKECAKYVYRELMKTSVYDVVTRVLKKLATRIVGRNPIFKVIETPRRFEFTSHLGYHRLAPLPVIGITAPHTSDGPDFPIRYDSIPTVVVEPRSIAVDYVDAMKDLIERAKRYKCIVRFSDGTEYSRALELSTDIAITLDFGAWSYRMSYDKEYAPSEPPEIYIEGYLYRVGDLAADGWEVDMIEANVVGYKTTAGDYYSGYGGVAIIIYDDLKTQQGAVNYVVEVKLIGRTFRVDRYIRYAVIFSNVFTLWAYIEKT